MSSRSIADTLPAWLGPDLAPSTREHYRGAIRRLEAHGVREVADLTAEAVTHFLEARRAAVSRATAAQDLYAIQSLASWLVRRGELLVDRLHAIRDLRERVSEHGLPEYLTSDEAARLRAAAAGIGPRLDLAVAIALLAGLRVGEIARLEGADLALDVPAPYLRVVHDGRRRVVKTRRGRVVPIPRVLAGDLARALTARELSERLGPLFPGRRILYITTAPLKAGLLAAREAAGLPRASWRILRHTWATRHLLAGVSPYKVARWAGHGLGVLYRHYGGILPGGDPDVERAFRDPDEAA